MPSLRPQELVILLVMLLFIVAVAVIVVWAGVSLAGRSSRARRPGGPAIATSAGAQAGCGNCGSAVQVDARFCPSCGASQSA